MPMPQRHVERKIQYLAVVARARRDAYQGTYRRVGPDQDVYDRAYRAACCEQADNGHPRRGSLTAESAETAE